MQEYLLIDISLIHFIAVASLSVGGAVLCNTVLQKQKRGSFERGRAWTEVDLANLHHNFQQLNRILPPGCKLLAVVKANAYGHGDTRIASELQKVGVDAFAVASLAEGIRLRTSGIKESILVLGYTYPKDAGELARYGLTQTIVDYNYGVLLNKGGKKIKVHIKVDTGMHRLGEDFDHITEISNIFQLQNLIIDGMYTHLCVADSLKKEDQEYTVKQIENFYETVKALKALGYHPPKLHIQSSYGLLNYPELRCNYARVGIALYGALSSVEDQTKVKVALRSVLSVKARVAMTKEIAVGQTVGYGRQFAAAREMKIATVTIGYADGISRSLTDGYGLVKGKKAPIIGRICMDQLTVDISEIPHVKPGDVVTLVGQDGPERISMEEVARQAGTISNELFSRLGSRLERIYI